jgi:cytochrome P450
VEALRPRIEQVTRELIERFRPAGRVELINEFAALVPIAVIMELLGAPAEDQAEFRQRSDIIINISDDDLARKPQAFAEMYAYITDLIEQKERQREFATTDLLGALIAMRDDEERLDHSELLSTAFLLLIAGYFTTLNLIGNGTLALIRHPDQLAALRADPSLFEKAIEEFLRYDCPITNTSNRFMTKDTELGGVTIPAGDLVLLCLGSANRDPAKFKSPDTLDIRRDASGHVAFTHGMHYCLGAPLARLEGRIAIRALLDNCADLALASDEKPQWRVSTTLQGLTRLPLTFTPVLQ